MRDSIVVGGIESRLSNDVAGPIGVSIKLGRLERVADVPIYRSDSMVRRSAHLQLPVASQQPGN